MSRDRAEFSKAIRLAVIKRATDPAGVIRCEKCGGVAKRFEIDHVNPDALTGKPTIENAELLCAIPCHREKTARDVAVIAKAKRNEAAHLGARPAPAKPIRSPGFKHTSSKRDRHPMDLPPRRSLYVGADQ